MRRGARGPLVLAVAAALLLGGCTSEPALDRAEVEAWIDARPTAGDPGVLASMAAPSAEDARDDREADGAAPRDEGIIASFEDPAAAAAIEMSCLGDGRSTVVATVTTGASATSLTFEDVDCAASPHREDLPASVASGIVRVAANELASTPAGAWHVALLAE